VTVATLLEKAYGSFSPRRFEATISALHRDLKVKIRVQSAIADGWVQIDVTGEDEQVALNLLDREIGLAPTSAESVGKSSALRGKILDATRSESELHVDIGVLKPKKYCAIIPLWKLQAQLSDGVKLPLQRLVALFCLYDFMPIHIKISDELNPERGFWESELSEAQLRRFSEWLKLNLDRLIVLGASRNEVEVAVERGRHFRDVIEIESLGPLEHAILCKLGTEAVGLIPKLGPHLAAANLAPFSPRKIKQLVKRPSL